MYWNPTVAVTLHSVTGWIVTLDVLKYHRRGNKRRAGKVE